MLVIAFHWWVLNKWNVSRESTEYCPYLIIQNLTRSSTDELYVKNPYRYFRAYLICNSSWHNWITVQSTYNSTHAWNFLRGATYDCDACHAALQHGSRQLLGMGHACGITYTLPATHGFAMFIIKPHISSSFMHVQCDTLHTCLFYLLFCVLPTQNTDRILLITSVPLRRLAWRKISASNAYACTTIQLTGNVARRYSRVSQLNPTQGPKADMPCTRPASNCVDNCQPRK